MIDYLAKSFLFFDNALFIFTLLTLGFIWFDRRIFYHAISLVFLSILVNVALKITFQVPLSPALHKKGFAFPSGHMQLATTLYLWLAIQVNNKWFRGFILFLLGGIGWGTIYFGYHNLVEILGGFCFALLVLAFYYSIVLEWPDLLPIIVISLATLLVIYIHFRLPMPHIWQGYYGLCGLIVAERIARRHPPGSTTIANKLLSTLFFVVAVLLIYLIFNNLPDAGQAAWIYQLKWLFIGFLLPLVNCFATKCLKIF